jgi:Xaa-Pro aminopeptidase
MNPEWTTSPEVQSFAARRRDRLVEQLERCGLGAALITDSRDIMYYAGDLLVAPAPACMLIRRDGDGGIAAETTLVCGEGKGRYHVDRVLSYAWHDGGTIHANLGERLVECAGRVVRSAPRSLGVQLESLSGRLMRTLHKCGVDMVPIDADIADLQREKDDLELVAITAAIASNRFAIDAAMSVVQPGVSEIDVHAAAVSAAMRHARRRVQHDGDYRSGAAGGPPRDRAIEDGELYIIDAWTNRSGYWADLASVCAVGDMPTRLQIDLISHVEDVHGRVVEMLRPGERCDEIWRAMDRMLREFRPLAALGLVHHGGHGIGLRLHEAPDINPCSTDVLRAGDVICIEPGGYPPEARAGARIERTYRVSAEGARCLSQSSDVTS